MRERTGIVKDLDAENSNIQKRLKEVDNYKEKINSKGTRTYLSTWFLDLVANTLFILVIASLVFSVIEMLDKGNYLFSPVSIYTGVYLLLWLGMRKLAKMNRIVSYRHSIKMYWELGTAEQKVSDVFTHPNDEVDIISKHNLRQISLTEIVKLQHKQRRYKKAVNNHTKLTEELLNKDKETVDKNK